jgi:hypothetical protein
MLVSSVPWSLTIMCGLLRRPMMVLSSLATLAPEIDVSATSARHSLLKSSTTHRMRNRLPQMTLSETKSSDQRWGSALRDRHRRTRAQRPLRPLRRRTRKPSSR